MKRSIYKLVTFYVVILFLKIFMVTLYNSLIYLLHINQFLGNIELILFCIVNRECVVKCYIRYCRNLSVNINVHQNLSDKLKLFILKTYFVKQIEACYGLIIDYMNYMLINGGND